MYKNKSCTYYIYTHAEGTFNEACIERKEGLVKLFMASTDSSKFFNNFISLYYFSLRNYNTKLIFYIHVFLLKVEKLKERKNKFILD